ncbi:poliovirus receptor-like isoform X2 [Dendronephthya gigantea]|uniref:poliovirus receptor-like isoform X2 n=1 Tax=Dendronephthya gigantea TaxID=151771 RepID=UPI00106C8092|nr:poliovirus receptor-like isoform X2 [Dendronephthya gigantea]
MTNFGVFFFVGVISLVFFSCEGIITQPPDGTTLFFSPDQSKAEIVWSFSDEITKVRFRDWSFLSSDGSIQALAEIQNDGEPKILTNKLLGIEIRKPATLILNKVNESYNGTYQFALKTALTTISSVSVFITKTPLVTVNCSRYVRKNISDVFSCLCEGQGGNPPARVTWYKDKKISDTGKESQLLMFRVNSKSDSGEYTCEAKSHENAVNKTVIELIVNYPPEETKITLTRNADESVTVKCSAQGEPAPSYKIFFNDTKLLASSTTYKIPEVNNDTVGYYKCVARNILGADSSQPKYLSITVESDDDEGDDGGLSGGAIAGIVIGVLVFIIIVAFLVYFFFCTSKEKSGYRGNPNVKSGGIGESHYELGENARGSQGDNEYDTAISTRNEGARKPIPETLPPVYAQVDKDNREGKPLYASLDTAALNTPSDSSKKRPDDRRIPTEYAAIDHSRTTEAPKADLV